MKNEKDFLLLNIDEVEPFNVSKDEEKAVIKHVLQKTKQPFRLSKWTTAALFTIGFSSISILAIPTIASKLPVIEQLLSAFSDDKNLVLFHDYATPVGQTAESNDVTIKIEDAVYDGYLLSIAFSAQSEEPLDDIQFAKNTPEFTGYTLASTEQHMQRVDANTYNGFFTYEMEQTTSSTTPIEITWTPFGFYNSEYESILSGDWSFSFELDKLDLQETIVNKTLANAERSITIERIASTGYTTLIYFTSDMDFTNEFISMDVKDNVGNTYEFAPTQTQRVTTDFSKGTVTIFGLDQNASSLLVTPKISTLEVNKPLSTELLETVDIPLK